MQIKLDENLSRHLKGVIEREGHPTLTAQDEGLLGRSDLEVAAAAKREGRLLFSLDLEFADLRKYPPGTHPGIVLFRPKSMGPMAVNEFVMTFVRTMNLAVLTGCVAVVDSRGVRVRRPSPDD